jgi:hypothetical protein
MNDLLVITLLIGALSIVQSMFGVGLLVFGTPALLILGHSFEFTLGCLLPASMSISLMQVWQGRKHCVLEPALFQFAVPGVIIGIVLVLAKVLRLEMHLVVGVMLVLTAIARFSVTIREWMRTMLKRHLRTYLAATGLVHGLSNLGGGPLTILMASLHRDRESIRANIALSYLIFSCLQLALLAVFSPASLAISSCLAVITALSVHALVGNGVFHRASEIAYQRLFNGFTFTFGLALLARKYIELKAGAQ